MDEEHVKHSEHTDGWKVLPDYIVRKVTTTVEDARQTYKLARSSPLEKVL